MIDERARAGPTPEQQAVMDHALDVPALVDAGAGTGKTYTIVERVAQLSGRGCPASSILLLTFSRKAAAELRGRIMRRLGPAVDPPECATFHAFALSILQEHAFELEISPDFRLINDIDARVLFWQAFDELIRGEHGIDGSKFALRFGVTEDLCAALYGVRQQLRDQGIAIEEFRRSALAAADAFASIEYRALIQHGQRGSKTVCAIDDADFRVEIEEERARVEAAAALFRRYDDVLRERQALTYPDLLDRAEGIVRSRQDVVASLRRRFTHCIVDEYQDTDPRQVKLLAAIFSETLERVMAVGDPRQSIYAFRGARPDNVDDFRKLAGCMQYALTENRRSRQEILDLAHSAIQPHFGDAEPLKAVRGAAGEQVVHAASRWMAEGHKAPKAARTRELEARWAAAHIAQLLASGRLIERQDATGVFDPIAPRHIAILNRRKTQLQPLLDALNAARIPFRQYGGAGFYEAPEVLDALAWLRLVANPFDDAALARAIASPAIGLCDASIATLCKGMRDDDERLAERMLLATIPSELDADSRERIERLRAVVDALEKHAGAPLVIAWEAALDRCGLALGAGTRSEHRRDQAQANLEKLSAMVRAFSDRNPGSRVTDFVRYMGELSRADADEQEADPPSADAVTVMTVHAAKGLEWPIVFVIDVWPDPPHDKVPARIDPGSRAFVVNEGPSGKKPFHTESIERQADGTGHAPAEKERVRDPDRDREERRLFYVALTRARDELWVSGMRKHPTDKNPAGRPHEFLNEVLAWLQRHGWETVDEPAPAGMRFDREAAPGAAPLPLADFVRDGFSRPAVCVPTLSFTSLAQYEKCARSVNYRLAYHLPALSARPSDLALAGGDRPAPGSLLSLGAYGQLVHSALESWARKPGKDGASYVAEAMRTLDAKPSKPERERAAACVNVVMQTFAGWRTLHIEAPFTLDLDGIALSGFIDLVAEDPAGRTFVIDYKTGVTPAQDYALQLALYRQAARDAYGIDVSGCRIARITEDRCELEEAALPDDGEVRRHVAAVAAGIHAADLTATPGPHCALCPYRAAPCMDFARSAL